jgi:hypothetical protein
VSVTVIQDVAFQRAFRRVPKDDLPQVLSIRNQIVADAPNLPALVDTLSVEALPDVRYTRHVPLTPWVIEYAWSIATQTLVLRTVSAPDPPF